MNEDPFDHRRGPPARLVSVVPTLVAAASVAILAASCTTEGEPLLLADDVPRAPGFVETADGGTDTIEFTSYCPSSECPAGLTTCPDSRYRCDVDLKSNRSNCGACGAECAADGLGAIYVCVDGRCQQKCDTLYRDCDGILDNGCEILPSTNDNCGECGVKCTDPKKPCAPQPGFKGIYACGCANDGIPCPRKGGSIVCVDPMNDDSNCGGCNIACDPMGGKGLPPPVNDTVAYGCHTGECGHIKCTFANGNCDDDMSNGCETRISTPQNCGGCGNVCPAGQDCRFDFNHLAFECKCPPGQTLCGASCDGDVCVGECKDLASDALNCGACGVECAGKFDTKAVSTCSYGACTRMCLSGWADCNGNTADSCEVNIDSDPKNCGGCGIVCDAVAGQACVLGRCVVAECEPDAGGPAR